MSKQRLSIGAVLMFISLGLGACHHAPFSASKIKAEAEAGDRGAQETLAAMYFIGDGVPVDREKQVFWLKKAAAQGSRYAYYRLGHNYEFGYGLAPDIFKAAEHYEIGSRLNSADAQTALAGQWRAWQAGLSGQPYVADIIGAARPDVCLSRLSSRQASYQSSN